MKKLFLSLFLLTGMYTMALAKIKLPAIIGDSMVLQRSMAVPVWGWADPGEKISVQGSWSPVGGAGNAGTSAGAVSAVAGPDGKWMLKIMTPPAGGPYDLTIAGSETIVLHGILTGEVWVCSGQSNMEMPVRGWGKNTPIKDSEKEIAAADYPNIRLFTVKMTVSYTPKEDVAGKWSVCSPSSVAPFSATAYFFGRELARKLKVPVGLINTTWGGTVAEAWTSAGALSRMGDFDGALRRVDTITRDVGHSMEEDRRNDSIWRLAMEKTKDGSVEPAFDDVGWKTMILPTAWEDAGYPGLDGIVWFRKTIDVPEDWAGKTLKLDLGPVDDYDITYFNGVKVGETSGDGAWATDRHYEVPGTLVKAGRNVIAVRVTDLQGNGGIYGDKALLKLFPAEGTRAEDSKGTRVPEQGISLAGEWKFEIKTVKPPMAFSNNPNIVTVLYNGMIAPLIPFGIRGVIWYQGEANVGRAAQYERLFPVMIADWRSRWEEGDFPFYFAQIAPFKYGGDSTQAAALRDAQRKTLAVPHTGMAVTLDIGNVTNIHPANKQEVGRRLALWALAGTYGEKKMVYSGPLYKSMLVRNGAVEVAFSHADGGLTTHAVDGVTTPAGDGLTTHGQELTGFEIAGADGRFVPAKASVKGDKVLVRSDAVAAPVAVRYGWSATAKASLFNGAGLPASSFSSTR